MVTEAYVRSRRCLAATSLLILATSAVGSAAATSRDRPYSLDDYFSRRELVSVAVAPRGRLAAIEIQRPAVIGESYVSPGYLSGDSQSRRSDIWILDALTGALMWKTDGRVKRETSFAPLWSPDGSELAFLEASPATPTRIVIWHSSTGQANRVEAIDVDLSTLISRGISPSEDIHNHFAWSDDLRLFVAGRGTIPRQPLGLEMAEDAGRKWNATWRGESSARVWTNGLPVSCDLGAKLFEISTQASVTQLFEGAISGVSITPDGTRIAVVSAREGLWKPGPGPLTVPASSRIAGRNDFLRWQVDVIDRASPEARIRTVASGEGGITRDLLPRWSPDGKRLGVVTGNLPQRPLRPETILIDFEREASETARSGSILSAQALATFYAALGVLRLTPQMVRLSAAPMITDRRENLSVFSIGSDALVVTDRGRSRIVRQRSVSEIDADGTIIGATTLGNKTIVYLGTAKEITRLDITDGITGSRASIKRPAMGKFAGALEDGSLVFFGDTDSGSFVWTVSPTGGEAVVARFNDHMAGIKIPEAKAIKYVARGESREAILYLPTGHLFGSRPPVIVTAYPAPQALSELAAGWIGNIHSTLAWHWHSILAAGFALYVVDFQRPPAVEAASTGYIETPRLIMSEIKPALAAVKLRRGVDTTKLGFVGYSYGGYTALTLLARTKTFKAIAAEVPLGNLFQLLRVPDELRLMDCAPINGIGYFQEIEDPYSFLRVGGPVHLNRRRMIDYSPSLHLESATTPTLLFAGEFDSYRGSAEQTYMTLLRKGVPAELVMYWGEGHVIKSPGNVRDMVNREIAWFTKYLAPSAVTQASDSR